jgi:hypothetical protein
MLKDKYLAVNIGEFTILLLPDIGMCTDGKFVELGADQRKNAVLEVSAPLRQL